MFDGLGKVPFRCVYKMFVIRLVVTGKLEKILLYIFQFMSWFKMRGKGRTQEFVQNWVVVGK